jgi:phosphotransferase system  glucose/maltose/N-acetylglucosamine-specific IIC component
MFITRFFVIFFSLIFALLAAGIALAIGVMAPELVTMSSDPVEKFAFFAIAFFSTSFVGATAFIPAVILITVAETFDIRSIFYYAIGGGLIAAVVWYMADISVQLENTTDLSPIGYGLQLVAAAGIIGGFVYWLLAGRKAGMWKNPYAAA